MSQNKFEKIWKILGEFSFQIDNEKNVDVICKICKKIMINACSGPCGCRYCLGCISKHLNENNTVCPGETDECINEELIVDNLQIDHAINIKISNFHVDCPNTDCVYKCALKHLADHIRVCGSSEINCHFYNIGCKQSYLVHDAMEAHFKSDIVLHSKLLLECVDHLRNEFEVQKKEIRDIKDENEKLKENNMKIERDNEELKITILSLKAKEIQQNEELTQINLRLKQIEKDQAKSGKLISEISVKNSDLIQRSDNMDNVITTTINDLQIKLIKMETTLENTENFGELEWIIENYSNQKKGTNIYSKSFYSHKFGYKLCLSANIGEFFIVVGLCFVSGEYDDNLHWPFKHGFTIFLMNQYDNVVYETIEINYDDCLTNNGWNKPTKEINTSVTSRWIVISPKIIKDDRIIIRCKLKLKGT